MTECAAIAADWATQTDWITSGGGVALLMVPSVQAGQLARRVSSCTTRTISQRARYVTSVTEYDAHFQHSRLRGSSRVCHLQRWGGGPHGALSSSCGLKGRPSSRSAQFQVRAQHVERTTLAGRANNQHPVTNTPCALPIQCQSQQIGRTKPSDPPLEVGLRCSWCPSFAL